MKLLLGGGLFNKRIIIVLLLMSGIRHPDSCHAVKCYECSGYSTSKDNPKQCLQDGVPQPPYGRELTCLDRNGNELNRCKMRLSYNMPPFGNNTVIYKGCQSSFEADEMYCVEISGMAEKKAGGQCLIIAENDYIKVNMTCKGSTNWRTSPNNDGTEVASAGEPRQRFSTMIALCYCEGDLCNENMPDIYEDIGLPNPNKPTGGSNGPNTGSSNGPTAGSSDGPSAESGMMIFIAVAALELPV